MELTRPARSSRFLAVVLLGIALVGCSSGDRERPTTVGLVVRGLDQSAQAVNGTESACLRQHLRANPMLADELSQIGDVDELDAVMQIRVYEALGPCVPTALGHAVVRTFLDATGASDRQFTSQSQADCVGASPMAATWLVDMRDAQHGVVMPSGEMRTIVSNVYLCGRDVVVDGPLSRALDVDRETAACAASHLETRLDLVPEVAALMFGQLEPEPSAGLEQVLRSCEPEQLGSTRR